MKKLLMLLALCVSFAACSADTNTQENTGEVQLAAGTATCPGDAYTLTPGTSLSLTGSVAATGSYTGAFCDPATDQSGGESVFALTMPQEGTFSFSVTGSGGFVPFAYLRSTCTDGSTSASFGCFDYFPAGPNGGSTDWDLSYFPSTIYLIVDGDGAGSFTLDVSLEAATCGDNVENIFTTTEVCDDGNTTSGDGCSSTCTLESAGPNDACPGKNVQMKLGDSKTETGTTFGYTDDYTADTSGAGACGGVVSGGPDRVYRIKAKDNGTLTATLHNPGCTQLGESECWDQVLWATMATQNGNNACGSTSVQVACSDSALVGGETISFPVVKNEDYILIVDGYSSIYGAGNYDLDLSLN